MESGRLVKLGGYWEKADCGYSSQTPILKKAATLRA